MNKEFNVKCTFGVCFENREDAYNFLVAWRSFIDDSVPVDSFDFHVISLNSRIFEGSAWDK